MSDFNESRSRLIKYLEMKTEERDWHGVSDAANDLRVLEATHSAQAFKTEHQAEIGTIGNRRISP